MIHEQANVSTNCIRLFEPCTQHASEARSFPMAFDHEAVLDQKYAASSSLATIRNDFPCLARSCSDVSTAERTQTIATVFVVVR
jgi:hypothetical protein